MKPRKQKRVYTPEEEARICNKVDEARERGLELKVVYQTLADELETTKGAVEQKYSVLKKKLREREAAAGLHEDIEQPPSEPIVNTAETSLAIVDPPIDRMVGALEKIVRERDYYKAEYERLLAERRKMQQLLGV